MKRLVNVLALVMLAGCTSHRATTPRVDAELSRDDSLARTAFDNGAMTRAADLYGQALKRATAMDDAAAISNAAYNLALALCRAGQAYQQAGDTPRAEDRLARAQRSSVAQEAKTGAAYVTGQP